MQNQAWIKSPVIKEPAALNFLKKFSVQGVQKATLRISAMGIYEARLNGARVGRQVLTPGWTSYRNRVQYQTYDVTALLTAENTLSVILGNGWARGQMGYRRDIPDMYCANTALVAELELVMTDGSVQYVTTDSTWQVYTSEITFAQIYDGETVDKTHVPELLGNAVPCEIETALIPQEGEYITEHEQLAPIELIVTPKGERVIDFGQNMTGYVSLRIKGNRGERVRFTCAEVLDRDGNFYNENYRTAKNVVTYILSGNEDFFKPTCSFQGFRYIRIEEYPDQPIDKNAFRAIAVHSELKRTGDFSCGNAKVNQLYHNIIWGQKSNYLDIPTDCPQRDERLGWTGDAQVFCRTAAMNFNVLKFFKKWLGDLRAEQGKNGAVLGTCPEPFYYGTYTTRTATGWGDVATIVPWTLYEIYGDKTILAENFDMMQKWVEYMHNAGPEEYLWLGGYHYGDWLAMDAGGDSYVGATSNDLIASAFFANSVDLLVRAGEVLGKDMTAYREMHAKVVAAFRSYFMENGMPKAEFPYTEVVPAGRTKVVDTVRKGLTQTAITLILHFNLCLPSERKALADKLEELIRDFGDRMSTGFLGTPYILHALSANGRYETAYKLFLQEKNPSWLYSVNHGATTMWEHWNSLKEDGSFWSTEMNSFNHYAYGAVADWMYGVICGIRIAEGGAGYTKVRIEPVPSESLGFAKCALETASGKLGSYWYYADGRICFEFEIPEGTTAEIVLPDGHRETVGGGKYNYSVLR